MISFWTEIKQRIDSRPELSRWSQLALWQRRAIKTLTAIFVLVAVSSIVYHFVMIVFEGQSPSYAHSLQVVIETYTGTGYGSDSPWESPVANVFVSVMDLSTFLLLFIIVPYVFRPVLENALSPTVPTSIDRSDHIVICGIEQQSKHLIEELEAREVNYVVIVQSEETALEFLEEDIPVIYGDPTSAETHRRACVDGAKAVVVDTEDNQSVSALLAIRELNEAIRTVVLVETLEHERHLSYAGADRVLTPRQLLGQRIAERITTEITPTHSDSITLSEDYSILELTVFEESPIHGQSIEAIESMAGETVSVLGMWRRGQFIRSPSGETVVDENTVLLIAGQKQDVRDLEAETYRGRNVEPTVIIAGYGVVGSTVRRHLQSSTADCTVVDKERGTDVDLVGDVTEEETLKKAGVEEVAALVMTISDDDEAILSVLLADQLTTDLDIIARMNHDTNETKVRRAGADYVLSLPEMSGRVLAQEVLHEEILSYSRQLKTIRIGADPFVGQTLENTEITETNSIVAAVQREGELLTDVAADFEFRRGDSIFLIGNDLQIDALTG